MYLISWAWYTVKSLHSVMKLFSAEWWRAALFGMNRRKLSLRTRSCTLTILLYFICNLFTLLETGSGGEEDTGKIPASRTEEQREKIRKVSQHSESNPGTPIFPSWWRTPRKECPCSEGGWAGGHVSCSDNQSSRWTRQAMAARALWYFKHTLAERKSQCVGADHLDRHGASPVSFGILLCKLVSCVVNNLLAYTKLTARRSCGPIPGSDTCSPILFSVNNKFNS